MSAALALAQIIIPLLPMIQGDVESLIKWIISVRAAAQQTSAWPAETDMAFRAALIATGKDPAYLLDSPATPA